MVKPILDRVFIRTDEKTATKGGIFVPETIDNPPTTGVVVGVGPEVVSVQIGDKVLFHIFDELPSYEKGVVVVRESSLLGVFEDE